MFIHRRNVLKSLGLFAMEASTSRVYGAQKKNRTASRAETYKKLVPLMQETPGFTTLRPSADSRLIFVSSSGGDDSYAGTSPQQPLRSIAKAKTFLRHGYPDWLLLKKGDVWDEGFGQVKTGGRSATEPLVFASYGTSKKRPLLRTGSQSGIITNGGGASPKQVSFVVFSGLSFLCDTRVPRSPRFNPLQELHGVQWLIGTEGLMFEDCVFQGYVTNIAVSDFASLGLRNLKVRRCQLLDAYATRGTHAQGIWANAVENILYEDTLLDHNGWSEQLGNADYAVATIYNHNIYLNYNTKNVTINNCVIARGASHGAQMRSGGHCENNLFFRNSISLMIGPGTDPKEKGPNGLWARVVRNVFLEGKDITLPKEPRGMGLDDNSAKTLDVEYNIFAHVARESPKVNQFAMRIIYPQAASTVKNNIIYDWKDPNPTPPARWVDPERSLASYNATLGRPADANDFLMRARSLSRDEWRPEYTAPAVNDYIRAGFKLKRS